MLDVGAGTVRKSRPGHGHGAPQLALLYALPEARCGFQGVSLSPSWLNITLSYFILFDAVNDFFLKKIF